MIRVIHGKQSPLATGAAGAAAGVQSYLDTKAVLDRMNREAMEFEQLTLVRDQQMKLQKRIQALRESGEARAGEQHALLMESGRYGLGRTRTQHAQQDTDRAREQERQQAASALLAREARAMGASREEVENLIQMDLRAASAWVHQKQVQREEEHLRQRVRRVGGAVMDSLMPKDLDPESPEGQQFKQQLAVMEDAAVLDPDGMLQQFHQIAAQRRQARRAQEWSAGQIEIATAELGTLASPEAQEILESALEEYGALAGYPEFLEKAQMQLDDARSRAGWLDRTTPDSLERSFFDPMFAETPEQSQHYQLAMEIRRGVRDGTIPAQVAVSMMMGLRQAMQEQRQSLILGEIKAGGGAGGASGQKPVRIKVPFGSDRAGVMDQEIDVPPAFVVPPGTRFQPGDPTSDAAANFFLSTARRTLSKSGKLPKEDDPKVLQLARDLATAAGWMGSMGTTGDPAKALDALTKPTGAKGSSSMPGMLERDDMHLGGYSKWDPALRP